MTAGAHRLVLLGLAVSVVHYLDNTINYADFPSGGPLPDPSRGLVGGSWLFFATAAVAALVALRRDRRREAALAMAVFAGSGLVGVGHYTVPGALDMPWWRHAHVLADIACGLALVVCALRLDARRGLR